MEGYIDLHNHSLCGVDDGAKTTEDSLGMLRMAYEDGVRGIVLTPHAHYRRGRTTPEEIRVKVALLQEQVKEACPELRLYPGNELYYDSSMADKIEYGEVCRLAESNYVLVEFSTEVEYTFLKNGFHEILCLGVRPILAHVERYSCLRDKKNRIEELYEMGVYFQANAAGVLGESDRHEKKFLKYLLRKGYLTFIASDAHDSEKRVPLLHKCATYISKKYGAERAKAYFCENPQRVLENKRI